MDIAAAVRDRREALGLTQEELADRAGLRQGHLSQIERGTRRPTLQTLGKLRDALELSPTDWMEWVDGVAA